MISAISANPPKWAKGKMPDLCASDSEASQLTYYDILGLSAADLETQQDAVQAIKRAYHRALLQHHPDKARRDRPRLGHQGGFTVDQISDACAVLSDSKRRADYDRALKLAAAGHGLAREPHFQTGVENADLDDLDYDEAQGRWYRSCRCGNPRGYHFSEGDLEGATDCGELIVGCQDCSLWLRVRFAVVEDGDGGHADTMQEEAGSIAQ